ncbi:MAG: ribonucleotide-diphosphate reductase subunit beta [Clostridiaceae bacterium]
MSELTKKSFFNELGDTETSKKRMINGNTTNLNDFNNMKYTWASDWYRTAMNNFWIPEEINMSQDLKDYRLLSEKERTAYDKVLSFLIFMDSILMNTLGNVNNYITASEVNLCVTIQAFQEAIHSQSYSYMLDTICSPEKRNEIMYQWKDDPILLSRNKFIGDLYNEFVENPVPENLVKTCVANYILEGIYFYSGFMFFYNLERNSKMPGSVQQIRYINRDETTHLWLFRNIIKEIIKEQPEIFTKEFIELIRKMIIDGVENEVAWGHYAIGDNIPGLNKKVLKEYIEYLGDLRLMDLDLEPAYGIDKNPMPWVDLYSDANSVKTDFFEAKSTAYAKAAILKDDL